MGKGKYGGFSVLKYLEEWCILSNVPGTFVSRKISKIRSKYGGFNLVFSTFRRFVNLNGNKHSINDTNFKHCHIGVMANTFNNCPI